MEVGWGPDVDVRGDEDTDDSDEVVGRESTMVGEGEGARVVNFGSRDERWI